MTESDLVPVRDAATVLLVRDPDGGPGNATASDASHRSSTLEVLMLTRREDSLFTRGAWVFPGGRLDPRDRASVDHPAAADRSDADASRLIGVERDGLAFWLAAARECFEEAGVLLARDSDGRAPALVDPAVAARFADLRTAVESEQVDFADTVAAEGLVLDLASMHYFAHWITPVGPPRRYDTRFFVAPAPSDQPATPDGNEAVACQWVRPADVLASYEAGAIDLIFPTLRSLEVLAGFPTAAAFVDAVGAGEVAAGDGGAVPVVPDHSGRRVALPVSPERPGDAEFEAAVGVEVLASSVGSSRGGTGA